MLAAESEDGLPLLDIFWTMLAFFYFALVLWLLVVALRDLFPRDDVSTGAKVGWTVLIFVLPLVGSVVYLGTGRHDGGRPDGHPESRGDMWHQHDSQRMTYVPNFH